MAKKAIGGPEISSIYDVPKCSRCGGAMVHELFYGDEDRFLGWRCIPCGEIIDERILENRRGVPGKRNR